MGLSNEERISGMYFAISNIVEHGRTLSNNLRYFNTDYKYLLEFIGRLWHDLLGRNSNGTHWILGSSAGNTVKWDTMSSWGLAITTQCNKVDKDDEIERPFDAFKGFLDIASLLSHHGLEFRCVFEIFGWSEQIIYYLRRYGDDLLKDFGDLNKTISDIQGECFDLFRHNDVYPSAYVLNQILKMIYGNQYPYSPEKWDILTKYLDEEHIHNYLNRLMDEMNLKFLAKMHIKMHKIKSLSLLDRIEAMLMLAGRKYHYDHQFKKLEAGLSKADAKKMRILFGANVKAHAEYEKLSRDDYERNQMSPLSIYGCSME